MIGFDGCTLSKYILCLEYVSRPFRHLESKNEGTHRSSIVSCAGKGSSRPRPTISHGNDSPANSLPILVSWKPRPSVEKSFPNPPPEEETAGGKVKSAKLAAGSVPSPMDTGTGTGFGMEEEDEMVGGVVAVGRGSGWSWVFKSVSTCSVIASAVNDVRRKAVGTNGVWLPVASRSHASGRSSFALHRTRSRATTSYKCCSSVARRRTSTSASYTARTLSSLPSAAIRSAAVRHCCLFSRLRPHRSCSCRWGAGAIG